MLVQVGRDRRDVSQKIQLYIENLPHGVMISFNSLSLIQAGRDRRDVSQKIQLLENRLDGVMINFNSTLAQNTIIRYSPHSDIEISRYPELLITKSPDIQSSISSDIQIVRYPILQISIFKSNHIYIYLYSYVFFYIQISTNPFNQISKYRLSLTETFFFNHIFTIQS